MTFLYLQLIFCNVLYLQWKSINKKIKKGFYLSGTIWRWGHGLHISRGLKMKTWLHPERRVVAEAEQINGDRLFYYNVHWWIIHNNNRNTYQVNKLWFHVDFNKQHTVSSSKLIASQLTQTQNPLVSSITQLLLCTISHEQHPTKCEIQIQHSI